MDDKFSKRQSQVDRLKLNSVLNDRTASKNSSPSSIDSEDEVQNESDLSGVMELSDGDISASDSDDGGKPHKTPSRAATSSPKPSAHTP